MIGYTNNLIGHVFRVAGIFSTASLRITMQEKGQSLTKPLSPKKGALKGPGSFQKPHALNSCSH